MRIVQTDIQKNAPKCEVVEGEKETLAEFLERIYPLVHKALAENEMSTAFRSYKLTTDSSIKDFHSLLQDIDVSPKKLDFESNSCVSLLSWNSMDNYLAVSCSSTHESWCNHQGSVAIYTKDHDDTIANEPKFQLPTESCVTDLKFHSVFPGVIAAGLFYGDIIIWNIQREDSPYVARDCAIGGRISNLSWINDINTPSNFFLGCTSSDGLLTIWNLDLPKNTLVIKERHQCNKAMPSNQTMEKNHGVRHILCFDFSSYDPETFVVGVDDGTVLECSLQKSIKLEESHDGAPLLYSFVHEYKSHKGEVYSVKFSPNRKDLFLTSGLDAEVRIYVIGRRRHVQIIYLDETLICAYWIPHEEWAICGCYKNGTIEILNAVNRTVDDRTKDEIKIKFCTQMEINKKQNNIVAIAAENGHVQLWRMPWALFLKM